MKATAAGNLSLDARAASLPAELPTLYVPTRGESARNAQRIVSAQTARPSVRVQGAGAGPAADRHADLRSRSPRRAPRSPTPCGSSGLGGQAATIQAALYGPYATREAITCTDTPVWTGTLSVPGDGEYVTAAGDADASPATTRTANRSRRATRSRACRRPARRSRRRRSCAAQPAITTQISAQETTPGAQITDSVVVTGLGKLTATVNVELWGPYPTREAIDLRGHAVLDRHVPGRRRRHVHHGAGHADPGRLLHLPRVDRGHRRATTPWSRPAARSRRRRSPRPRRRSRRSSRTR